jgi:glycosyltransferase involved in cell wall biosynthesis
MTINGKARPGPRVVVVCGTVFSAQTELWRACAQAGTELVLAGTDLNLRTREWPWQAGSPSEIGCALLRPVSPLLGRGHLWWWYRGLRHLLESTRPDVVHVASEPWGVPVLQTLALRARGAFVGPVCAHGADNLYRHGGRAERVARRFVLDRVLPRLDGLVSWNRAGVRLALAGGLRNSAPTAVIPASIPDPGRFRPPSEDERRAARCRLGLPDRGTVLGFVGRLVPEKGLGDLAESVRLLGASAPFVAVWGAGPLQEDVVRWLGKACVRGHFGGPLDFDEVPEALRACDVLVIPSRATTTLAEQFGRVAVEGMLSRCAVVGYRTGALPEVVGDGGLLVPEGDVAGLARAILCLSENGEVRGRLAARGRARALRLYDPATLAAELMRFWSEVRWRWASR